jgi:hypothetical protein
MLLQQGADRYITDNAMKRGVDLIDRDHWVFDNAGLLLKKDYIATLFMGNIGLSVREGTCKR